jgi:hypothetical protein
MFIEILTTRLVVEKSAANFIYGRKAVSINTGHIGALHALSINHHKSHINAGATGQFSSGEYWH